MLPLILLYFQETLGLTGRVVTRAFLRCCFLKMNELKQLERKRAILMDMGQVVNWPGTDRSWAEVDCL